MQADLVTFLNLFKKIHFFILLHTHNTVIGVMFYSTMQAVYNSLIVHVSEVRMIMSLYLRTMCKRDLVQCCPQSCADNLTCREISEAEAGCLVGLFFEKKKKREISEAEAGCLGRSLF